MLLGFILINIYFIYNWVLFSSLEKGDWNTVIDLLRIRIFQKKKYKSKYVSYFIEAAIQVNHLELLRELFEELQEKAFILEQDYCAPDHYTATKTITKMQEDRFNIGQSITQAKFRLWGKIRNRKHYRFAHRALKCLCEYAIEFGLPDLVDDPGHQSEIYFGKLCSFRAFQKQYYAHKYMWAELFYAIALFVQGKIQFAVQLLEQLLLSQKQASKGSMDSVFQRVQLYVNSLFWKSRNHLQEKVLIQMVCIQLLKDLQENQQSQVREGEDSLNTFVIDSKLLSLRLKEIQNIYYSPHDWSLCLLKEQKQNIAIVVIRQLINKAYEQQLQPIHQAYWAGLEKEELSKPHIRN